jgi:hypothetical protein
MARELKPEAVRRLGFLAVKDYLLAKGWRRARGNRPDVGIFRPGDTEDAEVLLPLRSDFADVDEGLARAVEEIARFEQRPAVQVLRDLQRPRADLLRFGVESGETSDGGIGFEEGLALLSGSRKALLAAACSVTRPQPFHPRMTLREAEAFVGRCRLGQTEQGSFIATIECELDVGDTAVSLHEGEGPEPFGRKATTLLIRSMARVVEALRADDLRALTQPAPGELVVSANLCEAIIEMIPRPDDAALRIGSSWSPMLPPPRGVPAFVRIERQYCAAITQVARTLRPTKGPTLDLFIGKVEALHGQPGVDGRMAGEVVLGAQVEDEILKIRLELGPADYAVACDAHRDGRYVSVHGILHRGARVHRLEDATGFGIVRG